MQGAIWETGLDVGAIGRLGDLILAADAEWSIHCQCSVPRTFPHDNDAEQLKKHSHNKAPLIHQRTPGVRGAHTASSRSGAAFLPVET